MIRSGESQSEIIQLLNRMISENDESKVSFDVKRNAFRLSAVNHYNLFAINKKNITIANLLMAAENNGRVKLLTIDSA